MLDMTRLVPEELRHVVIVSPRRLFDKVVEILLDTNSFHPTEPALKIGEPLLEAKMLFSELNEHANRFNEYYRILEIVPPQPVSRQPVKAASWSDAAQELLSNIGKTEQVLEKYSRLTLELKARLEELTQLEERLEPIKDLDVDLEKLAELKYFTFFMGEAPREVARELVKELSKYDDIVSVTRRIDDERSLVTVFAPKSREVFVLSVIQAYRVAPLEIPENLPKNPAKAYLKVKEEKRRLLEEQRTLREEIRRVLPSSYDVYYKLLTLKEAFRIMASARALRLFIQVEGYIPRKLFGKVSRKLEEASNGAVIVVARKEVRGFKEEPPTYVDVPRWLKPFHMITEMYGTPSPKEVVPTIFMAITFPLIYGLMFPDAGQALLLILAGYFFYKKGVTREGMRNVGILLMYFGAFSFATGMLAAEFFGPWTPVSQALHHLYGKPPYASPISPLAEKMIKGEEVTADVAAEMQELLMGVMMLSLRLGAMILVFGSLLGVINTLLEKRFDELLVAKLPKLLIFTFAGLPFLVASSVEEAGSYLSAATGLGEPNTLGMVVRYGFLASLLMLMLAEPVHALLKEGPEGLKASLGTAFMEVFDTILIVISNTVSFLRIMGLALAHSGIMFGFTILALLVYKGTIATLVGAILIYILGNLLVTGLEGIIVFAHTLRLHFYEWFSKFYHGTGVRYEPSRMWVPITIGG